MKERLSQQTMALRAAREFNDGDHINIGTGIPTLCALFIPEGKEVYFHAEQGVLGYIRTLLYDEWQDAELEYVDAGGRFIPTSSPGMSFFDMATSFDMVRGGHLDLTVLGGFQVSERGDLANWTRGSREEGGIGGGMDMASGAKKVIVVMTHNTKEGKPKIVNRCSFPLTAKECVDLIVTDLAVIEVTHEGLMLMEIAPEWTIEEIQALTEPRLIISGDLKTFSL